MNRTFLTAFDGVTQGPFLRLECFLSGLISRDQVEQKSFMFRTMFLGIVRRWMNKDRL